MNIDWRKAPEWANAVVAASTGALYFVEAFGVRSKRRAVSNSDDCSRAADMTIKSYSWKLIEERPKKQEAWDGGGDDLPPIGTVCEHAAADNKLDSEEGQWFKVEIIAHHKFNNDEYKCAVWVSGSEISYSSSGSHFRPIKTAEQLEEEERKTQLEVMNKIYMAGASEHKGGLAALYDAGYKLAK